MVLDRDHPRRTPPLSTRKLRCVLAMLPSASRAWYDRPVTIIPCESLPRARAIDICARTADRLVRYHQLSSRFTTERRRSEAFISATASRAFRRARCDRVQDHPALSLHASRLGRLAIVDMFCEMTPIPRPCHRLPYRNRHSSMAADANGVERDSGVETAKPC